MKTIKQQDLIDSVADALQYISYFHPPDYIRALGKAYELEQSPAARDGAIPSQKHPVLPGLPSIAPQLFLP